MLMRLILMLRYFWTYLAISLHAGAVWGMVYTVDANNERLRKLYPREFAHLQDIRARYLQ